LRSATDAIMQKREQGAAVTNWSMLTLVGEDRPGIVARVSDALYRAGCTLGEASMLRLGANFTIMMMVSGVAGSDKLDEAVRPVADDMGLRFHIDPIAGGLHRHLVPNVQVRVYGADRPGIVAQVTGALARCGFNILELESDVAGDETAPLYIMSIQGFSEATLETLEASLEGLTGQGIQVDVCAIETLIG
jgi:glycine cleavage system transcriptional repressor